jgi:SAM-dependent methyltransferase
MVKKIADRADVVVARVGDADVKSARTEAGEAELANEVRFLEALASTRFVPRLRGAESNRLILEDVVEGQPVQDEAAFLRACIGLLHAFRERGIRHGDLTAKNMIVRGDCPVALDFGESRFTDEDSPDKRPQPDAYYFWRAISEKHPGMRPVDRWIAVRGALGGDEDGAWDCLAGRDVLDLGCHTGETAAMAAAEGARAVGVDRDADVVGQARDLWGGFGADTVGCQFLCADIVGYEPEAADIVFLFSTWAYMVQEHGREATEETLALLIARSQVLFFETQLRGDGPGPDFLQSHADVGALLNRYGAAERLALIPVMGRGAYRSVWSVRGGR